MSLLHKLIGLVKEPPPDLVFEISEAGLACARTGKGAPMFLPFDRQVLTVSPLKDNVLAPETFAASIHSALPGNSGRRKAHRAVLVLPDYCARIAVLDFDDFPAEPAEQLSLIRFRMKRSLPFDVESAAISYHVQKKSGGAKKIEIVVTVVALEILARYEAPFRSEGIHPGLITTSSLASLDLLRGDQVKGISVLAKLCGRALTVAVLDGLRLKMLRCVELEQVGDDDVLQLLHPTVAFIEDELGEKPKTLILCGFGPLGERLGPGWANELGMTVDHLRTRTGAAGAYDAGLLGVLEGLEG